LLRQFKNGATQQVTPPAGFLKRFQARCANPDSLLNPLRQHQFLNEDHQGSKNPATSRR
jgi:hypothetical protein